MRKAFFAMGLTLLFSCSSGPGSPIPGWNNQSSVNAGQQDDPDQAFNGGSNESDESFSSETPEPATGSAPGSSGGGGIVRPIGGLGGGGGTTPGGGTPPPVRDAGGGDEDAALDTNVDLDAAFDLDALLAEIGGSQ